MSLVPTAGKPLMKHNEVSMEIHINDMTSVIIKTSLSLQVNLNIIYKYLIKFL